MRLNSIIVALLASAFVGISSAHAGVLSYYSDSVSWGAAVSNQITVTIPNPPDLGYLYLGNSATFSGVNFSTDPAASIYFYQVGTEYPADEPVLFPVLSVQTFEPGALAAILITFAAPVNAFSLNFGTFDGQAVTFTLSTGEQFDRSSAGGSYAVSEFVGITSSTYFSTVLVSATDEAVHLNNLNFSSAVPEPSTWAMMMLGFMGIAFLARRRSPSKLVVAKRRLGL